MVIAQRIDDKCKLVELQKRARCVGECCKWINCGDRAWSYLDNPGDGNYVICDECRYG